MSYFLKCHLLQFKKKMKNGLIGFASCILDKKIYLGGMGIHTKLKENGYRVIFPTKKIGEHNIPLYYPIDETVKGAICEAIIKKVQELMGGLREG